VADTIEWTITREQSLTLKLCQDVASAVLGGLILLAIVSMLLAMGAEALGGNLSGLLLALLLVLLGGPFSLLYLLPILSDAEQRPDRLQFMPAPYSPRRLLGLSIGGAIGIPVLALLSPLAAVLLVGTTLFGLAPLTGVLTTEGTFDPETRTLTVDDRTADLNRLTGRHRIPIGRITLLWLSYARGTSQWTVPRLVVLPTTVERHLRGHMSASIAAPIEPPTAGEDTRDSNRTVQATLVTFALLFLGVAVGQFLVADLPTAIAIWASSVMTLFALIFLWLAVRE